MKSQSHGFSGPRNFVSVHNYNYFRSLSLNYLTKAEWFRPLGGSEARCKHNTDFLQYKTIKALKTIMVWIIFKFPTSWIYFELRFEQSWYLSTFNPCLNLPLFYFSLPSPQFSIFLPLRQEIRKFVTSFSTHLILSWIRPISTIQP